MQESADIISSGPLLNLTLDQCVQDIPAVLLNEVIDVSEDSTGSTKVQLVHGLLCGVLFYFIFIFCGWKLAGNDPSCSGLFQRTTL